MNDSKRIKSLEALRGIAFLTVVLHHVGNPRLFVVAGGAWAVSIFFIISGFVETLSQLNKKSQTEPTIKNNIKYGVNKIKKIYPIHVLTTLALVVFDFVGNQTEPIKTVAYKIITNLLLIQEWPPFRLRSVNTPSWYLCALLVFYFLSPTIMKTIKNNYSVKKALKNIIVIFIIQIVIGVIGYLIPNPIYSENMLFEYDITYWFVYRFPLSRLLDILLGCNLAYLFMNNSNRMIKNVNKKEIATLIVTIMVLLVYYKNMTPEEFKPEIPIINKERWWTLVILYTPISLVTVWLFAYGQGKITNVLTNKVTLFLARISASGFLIHTVVYHYLSAIIYFVIGTEKGEIIMFNYGSYINITIGVLLTFICCLIWERLSKSVQHVKQRKTRKDVSL